MDLRLREPRVPKPLAWVGSARADLAGFPGQVRREFGFSLYLAQLGIKGVNARPLRGFGGASVLEIVVAHEGNAFRAAYTVAFPRAVFVLHAFQKKSKTGIATPQSDIALIQRRLAAAARAYRDVYGD